MKYYDVSVTLREGMPIYPGDPSYHRELRTSLAAGEDADVSALRMGAHTGTHVDAPGHMIQGQKSIDAIDPAVLVGPAEVVAIHDPRVIGRAELERHCWDGVERVLFKTANADKLNRIDAFVEDFIAMDGPAGAFLAERGLRLVGVDYLSVDRLHSGTHPAHMALMRAGIVLIEGLDLSQVPPGRYELFCGPLKIKDGDAGPARVFLRELPPPGVP